MRKLYITENSVVFVLLDATQSIIELYLFYVNKGRCQQAKSFTGSRTYLSVVS